MCEPTCVRGCLVLNVRLSQKEEKGHFCSHKTLSFCLRLIMCIPVSFPLYLKGCNESLWRADVN